ncbi:hypothetical protein [Ferroacidibacillus organovorans]|uniref:Uncharacterized protein n=1 Tax=Ferroacidibacillus organovorans TaxID=1765683 RepID=A0A124IVY5_9BACL|nr:hypothetical protein [Ferroacidibacillus organovorans]KUO95674.1 hypothetical protein ATW55_15225 [Ferroacidibacillus organovorans]
MSFSCTTSGSKLLTSQQFYNIYGPFSGWASFATGVIEALIITQWYHESNKGQYDICTPYNNPANYGGSGPANPYSNICDGTLDGYINPMLEPSLFKVSASDGVGDAASAYIMNAYTAGYTVPAKNGYGNLQGAGTKFGPGFEAACAAMGAMGWASSNYYTSGDSPDVVGNILMNWYNDYFTSIVPTNLISSQNEPSCCF